MYIQKRRIVADDEIDAMPVDNAPEVVDDEGAAPVAVEPEASDLLFEAEDVAELLAEATGQAVEVTADEDQVVFAVGEDEYTVTPEPDTEVLEAVRKPLRGKKPVKATTTRKVTRPAVKMTSKKVK